MDTLEKVKDIESLRTVLKKCKKDPDNVPFSEWSIIADSFCELIDADVIPFEPGLSSFCNCLIVNHSNKVEDACVECDLTKECGYKDEKRVTSFNSFNLGMLYGIALARVLYTDVNENEGRVL